MHDEREEAHQHIVLSLGSLIAQAPAGSFKEHRKSSDPPLQVQWPTPAPDRLLGSIAQPCTLASSFTGAPDLPTPSQPTTCVPPAPQTKDDKLCVGIDELCET